MFEPREYESRAVLLRHLAEFLHGSGRGDVIALEGVYGRFQAESQDTIDWALKKMDALDLVRLQLKNPLVRMTPYGSSYVLQNCIPEVILGPDYVVKKYRAAVVHIIVEGSG